jgi:hypothetical protein
MTNDLISAIEFLVPYAETIIELKDKVEALQSVQMDTEASQRALSKAKADLKSTTEARIASEKGIQNVKQAEVEFQARMDQAIVEVNERSKKIIADAVANAQRDVDALWATHKDGLAQAETSLKAKQAELIRLESSITERRKESDSILASMSALKARLIG